MHAPHCKLSNSVKGPRRMPSTFSHHSITPEGEHGRALPALKRSTSLLKKDWRTERRPRRSEQGREGGQIDLNIKPQITGDGGRREGRRPRPPGQHPLLSRQAACSHRLQESAQCTESLVRETFCFQFNFVEFFPLFLQGHLWERRSLL